MQCAFVCVIKVSVPVAEVVGVEEGRIDVLPRKSVEDTDKDFTGGFRWETLTYGKHKATVNVNRNYPVCSIAHLLLPEMRLLIIYIQVKDTLALLFSQDVPVNLHSATVDIVVLQHGFVYHLSPVFYVKRCSSGSSYGLLWRLGQTQFSCPSRVLRDQWTKHLRTALKTHSTDGSKTDIMTPMYLKYIIIFWFSEVFWLSTTCYIPNISSRSVAAAQTVGVYQPIWREKERKTDLPLSGCPSVWAGWYQLSCNR